MDEGRGGQMHPTDDSWVAAVHASETDESPLGCGIVIDEYRILTCAHVVGRKVQTGGRPAWVANASIWVAFPKAEEGGSCSRLRVNNVIFPSDGGNARDLAVLYLPEPVPGGVAPAPLRCPKSADLVSQRWWAFGFPYEDDPMGDAADGIVGASLGYGWIRLDTASRYPVKRGFSGGGMWSPDYNAVVAVVGQARGDKGDGRAITLYQADKWFPDEKIWSLAGQWSAPQAGEVAMAAWGWSLSGDQEATRHWQPRGRGVSIGTERGYRFRGRTAALEVIRDWLDRDEPDRRVLVVTGAPGTGKSAVLGRIVTTADADSVAQLPASDTGIRATVGSVGCAVHAKGKTSLEVATEIARAASAALPERIEDFAAALHDALSEQGRRFNVIIDALDEADSPAESQAIITKIIVPMAETCMDVGVQVVVGSRRTGGDGDLLGAFAGAARLVDLDEEEFFSEDDLATYALATLQLTGDERSGNPYSDDAVAGPVADQIAALSERNFLVAGLTARAHGLYDDTAVVPEALSFSAKVDDAMREYLRRIPPIAVDARDISAEILLTALAFAEAPGLPVGLWRVALRALGAGDVPTAELIRFAKSSAASFLVESSGDDGRGTEFRLFHQALNDALLHWRSRFANRVSDERKLARAFLRAGQESGWERAPAYLLRSLPTHAARAGLIDYLFSDDEYLLYADLRRVMRVADRAMSSSAKERARLLGLTLEAVAAGPVERVALFGVTETMDGIDTSFSGSRWQVPYRARWAAVSQRHESFALRGHRSSVNSICGLEFDDRLLLASADIGGTVILWDPADGSQSKILQYEAGVRSMCAVEAHGETILAISGDDKALLLWNTLDDTRIRIPDSHSSQVEAMCTVMLRGRILLVSAGADGIRLWDPADGSEVRRLDGLQGGVHSLCSVEVDGRTLLASGGGAGTLQLWDPADGSEVRRLDGLQGGVYALCSVKVDGQTLLASGGGSLDPVRLWDPADGTEVRLLGEESQWIEALCSVEVDGRTLLASGGGAGALRLWDPADGSEAKMLTNYPFGINSLCSIVTNNRTLLASAGHDKMVRLWDLGDSVMVTNVDVEPRWIDALHSSTIDGRSLLVSAGIAGLRLWNIADGSVERELTDYPGAVMATCSVVINGRTLIACTRRDGLWLWDSVDGTEVRCIGGGREWPAGPLCSVEVNGRTLLASHGNDFMLRLWDPIEGTGVRSIRTRQQWVSNLCAITVKGRAMLAAGGTDGLRLWDLAADSAGAVIDVHQGEVNALCTVKNEDHSLLAYSTKGGTVRLWDPADGAEVWNAWGNRSRIYSLCGVMVDGRALLASGGDDESVRLWDLADGRCVLTIPVHHGVRDLAWENGSLAVALNVGLLVLKLNLNAALSCT